MFNNIYQGKRVYITGHTGFKGSWLSAWLLALGGRCGRRELFRTIFPQARPISKAWDFPGASRIIVVTCAMRTR